MLIFAHCQNKIFCSTNKPCTVFFQTAINKQNQIEINPMKFVYFYLKANFNKINYE